MSTLHCLLTCGCDELVVVNSWLADDVDGCGELG